ncbi:unnamed protein product [Ilex paraguariensis]|uniref:Uncharacterized protein n=1 Tax=Ilex paraguariensis TaxID=185542 RepID=A0ABC8S9P4_9AQUA
MAQQRHTVAMAINTAATPTAFNTAAHSGSPSSAQADKNAGKITSERDLEKGLLSPTAYQNPIAEQSPSPSSAPAPALVLSNSGNRIDQSGKKKYVKQVTGRHNDSELHLAAQRGDLHWHRFTVQDDDTKHQ